MCIRDRCQISAGLPVEGPPPLPRPVAPLGPPPEHALGGLAHQEGQDEGRARGARAGAELRGI
eukprot:10701745-Alexandrium_andersonii.AAC.1